jgi:hypothetical protein
LVYDIAISRYTAVATSPGLLQHPSLSDNGLKVAWLASGGLGGGSQILFKNLISTTVQSVASGIFVSHPQLTADGNFIIYQSNLFIVTKDLNTGQVQAIISSPGFVPSYYEPTWQKSFVTPKALGAVAQSYFGSSVSVSGNFMVVGATGENNYKGAAYLYRRNSQGTWTLVKRLLANDGAAGDRFGISVSISGDTVVVGAYLEDHDTNGNGTIEKDVGAAYIFQRDQGGANNWGQVKKLIANGDAAGDRFGTSVSISGNTVVVGAYREDHDTDGNGTDELNAGAAYIFAKDQGSLDNWGQVSKLTAFDGAGFDFFGNSVSISGNKVVVGVRFDDNSSGTDAGAVYIYE